ncbi:MAG: cell wall hydrolase [Novosphingobium sp.]|nr:cell wall hydrolase [Novosphingobium sp.]
MRTKLHVASGIAVAATMLTVMFSATGSGAMADEATPVLVQEAVGIQSISQAVVAALPEEAPTASVPEIATPATPPAPVRAASLAGLVKAQPVPGALDSEMRCLAGAIYFEARGESLAGQLAVGRVIVERASSHRFPSSYCGVVFQRSQFSFVRGNSMPSISEGSAAWKKAVAVAQIADQGTWDSPAEGALFFHASRVSPGWRLKRLAQVDNHIFYR